MKARTIQLLFLLFSIFFILLVLSIVAKPLHLKRLEEERIANIQKVCMKEHPRERKKKIPQRSLEEAEKEIYRFLHNSPLLFKSGAISFESNESIEANPSKVSLNYISKVLSHIDEEVIVMIEVHTDKDGTNKQNLKISQERADMLKAYIDERCKIKLIVAIGYGEEIPLPKSEKKSNNRRVEIHLKRIHP